MLSAPSGPLQDDRVAQLFAAPESLNFPPTPSAAWQEKAKRFQLLLSVHKGGASEVPSNLEARRRINFFANSLFMHMPAAPRVRFMQSFSVLTPYYSEDVLYGAEQIRAENEDGVSILFYLQKIYPGMYCNLDTWVSRFLLAHAYACVSFMTPCNGWMSLVAPSSRRPTER